MTLQHPQHASFCFSGCLARMSASCAASNASIAYSKFVTRADSELPVAIGVCAVWEEPMDASRCSSRCTRSVGVGVYSGQCRLHIVVCSFLGFVALCVFAHPTTAYPLTHSPWMVLVVYRVMVDNTRWLPSHCLDAAHHHPVVVGDVEQGAWVYDDIACVSLSGTIMCIPNTHCFSCTITTSIHTTTRSPHGTSHSPPHKKHTHLGRIHTRKCRCCREKACLAHGTTW